MTNRFFSFTNFLFSCDIVVFLCACFVSLLRPESLAYPSVLAQPGDLSCFVYCSLFFPGRDNNVKWSCCFVFFSKAVHYARNFEQPCLTPTTRKRERVSRDCFTTVPRFCLHSLDMSGDDYSSGWQLTGSVKLSYSHGLMPMTGCVHAAVRIRPRRFHVR